MEKHMETDNQRDVECNYSISNTVLMKSHPGGVTRELELSKLLRHINPQGVTLMTYMTMTNMRRDMRLVTNI